VRRVDPSARPDAGRHQLLIGIVLAAATMLLGWRLCLMVQRYSVNLLFSDHWVTWQFFLEPRSPLEIFLIQHGPPRLGAGMVLTWLLARLTDWNVIAESYAVAAMLVLAAALALILKRRLTGSLSVLDVSLPVLVLNTLHYELLVIVPFLAHSAVPLVLLLLAALAWTLPARIRLATALSLNFLLVFSGFGFLAVGSMLLILALELWRGWRSGNAHTRVFALCGALIVVATFALFLVGHRPDTAATCFQFPNDEWRLYPLYIVLMNATLFGASLDQMPVATYVLGTAGLLTLISVTVASCRRYLRGSGEAVDRCIVFLGSFTLLFCIATAVGRSCLGLHLAQSSRYMILMLPGYIAVYLALLSLRSTPRIRQAALWTFFIAALLGARPWEPPVQSLAADFARRKAHWVDCYLATGNLQKCQIEAAIELHPDSARVEALLAVLRERRLNFFAVSPERDAP
jgi:hypothetical protein